MDLKTKKEIRVTNTLGYDGGAWFSPDGKKVVIDSPHEGNGRQMYLIDIENLI
jgi:Tol biopolymer transport system component